MVHTLPTSGTTRRRTFSSAGLQGRYQARNQSETNVPLQFHTFRSHQSSDPLSCLAIINDENRGYIAFAGGHDDVILAYGIKSACGLASVFSHRDAVTGLVLIEVPFVSDGQSTHIMVSSSWDATVKLWNVTVSDGETVRIGKEPFAELYEAETPIHCVDALYIPEVGIIVAAGGAGGSLIVWLWNIDGGKYFRP
jgi:WD40 repeat protein